jgi:hypothetical protein
MLVRMCCRQKDRVAIDAAAKLDHVQFRNKNVEYNYCLENDLVWDFCIMVDRYPFLSAKHSCQTNTLDEYTIKLKKDDFAA